MGSSQIAPRTGARRIARAAIVIVAVAVILFAARLLVAPLPSERSLGWRSAYGFPGAGSGPGTVVPVEVERPACAPDGTSWLATPVVTYTPLAVFITIRMDDTFDTSRCSIADDGLLPTVGYYLTGTYLPVQLSEPIGGRALFDGSALLPGLRQHP
jgi:hypothetical protein